MVIYHDDLPKSSKSTTTPNGFQLGFWLIKSLPHLWTPDDSREIGNPSWRPRSLYRFSTLLPSSCAPVARGPQNKHESSWLVNKDPYNGVLIRSLHNWLVFHPLYNPTNHVFFFIAHLIMDPRKRRFLLENHHFQVKHDEFRGCMFNFLGPFYKGDQLHSELLLACTGKEGS